jgi:phage-related protein
MANLPYKTSELIWVGSSKEDLSAFPGEARRIFGFALRQVQNGETPSIARPLSSFGSGVFELRASYEKNAYRVVYLIKLAKGVYVLDAFLKKSKMRKAIPHEIRERIEQRVKYARRQDRG